jgi:hypothetical protein
MKNTLTLFAMILSFSSFAQEKVRREFDENLEKKCHMELKALGCEKASDEGIRACAELKKRKLSVACKAYHEALKQN